MSWQILVEPPDPIEHVAAVAAVRNRVHLARGGRLQTVVGVSHSEAVRQRHGYGLRQRRRLLGLDDPASSHVVRFVLQQPLDTATDVLGRVGRVRVHAQDHFAARRTDAQVHGAGSRAARVVQQGDPGVLGGDPLDQGNGPVVTLSVHDEDLEALLGEVARHDRSQAVLDVPCLVAARYYGTDDHAAR
jgi:hypothetical protein